MTATGGRANNHPPSSAAARRRRPPFAGRPETRVGGSGQGKRPLLVHHSAYSLAEGCAPTTGSRVFGGDTPEGRPRGGALRAYLLQRPSRRLIRAPLRLCPAARCSRGAIPSSDPVAAGSWGTTGPVL